MKTDKRLCIAWFFNKDGIYELCAVHSGDFTQQDMDMAYRQIGQLNPCPSPIPVVFLDRQFEKDAGLCSYLAAKAQRLLASPPFSDPAAV
jgi:hypothetical protein